MPGGSPAQLTGPVTLCGRADLDPDRFFSGSLAGLMAWARPLGPDQVAALWAAYQQQSLLFPVGLPPGEAAGAQGVPVGRGEG